MVADLFNIYHTHQNESIEKASEMHTSTHPSHHLYHVWLACVRDMAFYVCLDLCSHHFLPLVSNTGAGNALVRTCVCVREYVLLFGDSFSSCFYVSFVIFSSYSSLFS